MAAVLGLGRRNGLRRAAGFLIIAVSPNPGFRTAPFVTFLKRSV
jgi:hypothetical protein